VRTLLSALILLTLQVGVSADAARRVPPLPMVPHYEQPFPSPPLVPIKPPQYIEGGSNEQRRSGNNTATSENPNKTVRQWLAVIYNKTIDDPVTLFTAVLAVSTIALWLSTRRLAKDARISGERQLRAYILGNGGVIQLTDKNGLTMGTSILSVPQNDVFARVRVVIKNFGLTPAYNFTIWRSVNLWDTDQPQYGNIGETIGKDTWGRAPN
jgi:hypothetical protein